MLEAGAVSGIIVFYIKWGKDMSGVWHGTRVYHTCIRCLVVREHFCSMNGEDICSTPGKYSAGEKLAMIIYTDSGMRAAMKGQVRQEEISKVWKIVSKHPLSSVPSFLEKQKDAL